MNIKKGGGAWYPNEVWYSDAYHDLNLSGRELFHCLRTELRYSGKGKKRRFINNGELSYTETSFKKQYGYCSSTYLKARNKLIEVGFIKQTYRGGNCRGDRAKYKILVCTSLPVREERWRRYPKENWAHEIPKIKKQSIGKNTRWKKGQSGRKKKDSTLLNRDLNGNIPPNEKHPSQYELPI